MFRALAFLAAFLLLNSLGAFGDEPADDAANLAKTLPGAWRGGACVGLLIIHPDHTFERHKYTPGNNKLTGSWELREKSFPPLLVLTTKTTNAPDRLPVGKSSTYKLMQVDDETLAIEDVLYPGGPTKYERVKKGDDKP